ncbi:MAG: hypothetical protein LBK25_02685 [Treponema sp.]|nr:hypothetical protein [Treponema sp.]
MSKGRRAGGVRVRGLGAALLAAAVPPVMGGCRGVRRNASSRQNVMLRRGKT